MQQEKRDVHDLTRQHADLIDIPCQILDLDFETYLALPYPGSHYLSELLRRSPMSAEHARRNPKQSQSLTRGSLVHALLLEPDKASERFVRRPPECGKTSNAAKQELVRWLQEVTGVPVEPNHGLALGKQLDEMIALLEHELELSGIQVVSDADWDSANNAIESAMARSGLVRAIFDDGVAESTTLAYINGTAVKTRPDWLPAGHDLIVDVKTTRNCAWESFSKDIANYDYHMQAALYLDAEFEHSGKRKAWAFFAQELEEPYESALHVLSNDAIADGRKRVHAAIRTYQRCKEHNIWPGIGWDWQAMDYQATTIDIPNWSRK